MRDMTGSHGHNPTGIILTGATSPDVHAALEAALTGYYGRQRRILKLTGRVSPYSTSFTLTELDATLDDGVMSPLMLKDSSWRSLHGDAIQTRPRFLHNPRRE